MSACIQWFYVPILLYARFNVLRISPSFDSTEVNISHTWIHKMYDGYHSIIEMVATQQRRFSHSWVSLSCTVISYQKQLAIWCSSPVITRSNYFRYYTQRINCKRLQTRIFKLKYQYAKVEALSKTHTESVNKYLRHPLWKMATESIPDAVVQRMSE